MRRVDIIANAIRGYGMAGTGINAADLAEWIDEAIRFAMRDEASDSYDRGYGEGWMDGTLIP